MITIAKTVIGISALASAGAWTAIDPEPPVRTQIPAPTLIPTINANGKVANRLPTIDGQTLSGSEIVTRIRMAHGLTGATTNQTAVQVASVDCKLFAWPHIPSECLTPADGSTARRPVRVISSEARTVQSAAPQLTATATQPAARLIRN